MKSNVNWNNVAPQTDAAKEADRAWAYERVKPLGVNVRRSAYVLGLVTNPLRDCAASRAFARRIVDGGTR